MSVLSGMLQGQDLAYFSTGMIQQQNTTKTYMIAVLLAGAIALGAAFLNVPLDRVDLYFLLLFCFTIGIGSRVTVQIPQLKSHIAVSDTFIFLALLIFGGELAVILAAIEATFSSWRFCSKKITVFFNTASAALSTTAVILVLNLLGLVTEAQLHGYQGNAQDFVIALSVMSLVQFVVNTSLAAIYDALNESLSFWDTWKEKYLWAFITFLVGAVSAGILVQLSNSLGFGVIIIAFPVILLLYFTYRMYLTTVQMSIDQAKQANDYAQVLEERSSALRESEERFRSAFTHAPIGIALVAADGKWLRVNMALCDILEYTEKELLSVNFRDVTHPDDLVKAAAKIGDVLSGRSPSCQIEQRYLSRLGRMVWASVSVSPTSDSNGVCESFVFQIQDITAKKIAEEKLLHDASHDSLTGLPNRSHFMNCLNDAIKRSSGNPKYRVSVLFIDLDRFKHVNDSLGHQVGDELLVAIAQRLNSSMRPPDMVARLGGDEFVVLVEGRYYAERVTKIAERIQKKISAPFRISGHEVFSSASIGILNVADEHRTADDIIRDADTAMYQAKRSGKARHEVFDDKMRTAARETLQLETDLRRAVLNGEIEVFYQPIFSLKDDRLYGLEALARWNHPSLGVVAPKKFVPLAEEIGIIDALGDSILRAACQQVRSIQQRHSELRDLRLSINLSSRQFRDENLVERIGFVLDETGFPHNRLTVEITETVFFEYHDHAIETLRRLRETGIETDIDDFGTGYSNLGYLVRLPISTLKIDRSFIMMMSENVANREVIRTILSLADNLGLKVIAEGIESETQRDALRALDCDFGQGYFYSRPLSSAAIEEFIVGRGSEAVNLIPHREITEYPAVQ